MEKLTDRELIESLRICSTIDEGCENCHMNETAGCGNRLRILAAQRLEALTAVEQKNDVSQETGEPQEGVVEITAQLEPERTTRYISIALEEYTYLRSLDVLLDILLGDGTYSTFQNVLAVRKEIRATKERKVAGQE